MATTTTSDRGYFRDQRAARVASRRSMKRSLIVRFIMVVCGTTIALSSKASVVVHAEKHRNVFSPVPGLAESLAASAAHGTVVAVRARYDDEVDGDVAVNRPCVVLLSNARSATEHDDDDDDTAPSGRPLTEGRVDPHDPTLRVLHRGGVAVGATGFGPDVRHLLRVVAARIVGHESVWPSSSSSSSGGHPSLRREVVEPLADQIASATLVEGGRPFGVQFLLVGSSSGRDDDVGLDLYTLDPSGGWRFWGGRGTAVGRKAEAVRRRMWEELQKRRHGDNDDDLDDGVEGALELCLRALHTEEDDNNVGGGRMSIDRLSAAIVIGSKDKKCCLAVDRSTLRKVHEKCFPPTKETS